MSTSPSTSWTSASFATHSQHLWPAGAGLAQLVWQQRKAVAGKRVLELGAGGTGLPGQAALRFEREERTAQIGAVISMFHDAFIIGVLVLIL